MIQAPKDGWTEFEKHFIKMIIIRMYSQMESLHDKFILIASTEAGYTQQQISEMLNCSQSNITQRLRRLRKSLKSSYGSSDEVINQIKP